jgi:integrase/recombinase XerC
VQPVLLRDRRRNNERDELRYSAGRQQRTQDGVGAVYNAAGAWRHLFDYAVRNGYAQSNPAKFIVKPNKKEAERTSFNAELIGELLNFTHSSDDPDLDAMIIKFHLITGARQEGALNLIVRMIDPMTCYVVLDEKNGKIDRQPIPDWFAAELLDFATRRGAVNGEDKVFRKRTKHSYLPIGPRRYNYIFERIQANAL